VAERRDPVTRILDGLVAAIDRHGSQKVSVADVCAAAGVSRGTVYRYFPTREELFAALGPYTVAWVRRAVTDAVAHDPEPGRRIAVVVAAVRLTGDGEGFREAYRSEPAWVLTHFRSIWDEVVALLADALVPAFPPRGAGGADVEVAADVLARHLLSRQLVSSDHTGEADLVRLLEAYAGS
jgi:AcrR family transcriptional regulator